MLIYIQTCIYIRMFVPQLHVESSARHAVTLHRRHDSYIGDMTHM